MQSMTGLRSAFLIPGLLISGVDRYRRLKTANEDLQRNKRKARAEGRLPPHAPRWFNSTTDRDTSERLWEPKRADNGEVLFWAERERAGQKGQWEGVDHIFVEDV